MVLGGVAVSYERGTPVFGKRSKGVQPLSQSAAYRGTSPIRPPPPPRTAIGAEAWSYCRVLGVQGYLTHKKTQPAETLP